MRTRRVLLVVVLAALSMIVALWVLSSWWRIAYTYSPHFEVSAFRGAVVVYFDAGAESGWSIVYRPNERTRSLEWPRLNQGLLLVPFWIPTMIGLVVLFFTVGWWERRAGIWTLPGPDLAGIIGPFDDPGTAFGETEPAGAAPKHRPSSAPLGQNPDDPT